MAGRITLAQSALASGLSYIMQTTKIPVSICNKIDKICRNFFWGGSDDKKKLHLVRWENICKPKRMGRFEFRKVKQMNEAFLMKLGWSLINRREERLCGSM